MMCQLTPQAGLVGFVFVTVSSLLKILIFPSQLFLFTVLCSYFIISKPCLIVGNMETKVTFLFSKMFTSFLLHIGSSVF